ncbi:MULTISPECIES: hypothetical protein [unclassified Paracoccus (in: a-proteobacteria)]|uniref:hypothetical protein n=1 Tax=unclassified Paracoccus (in: a-proteobacteria) TaxID=2688777 RepID=UPI0012B29FEF|nr:MULTISPECIES: hypothetical protein [unclassified Paracoccus (in: a-proteobacteria)]UXU73703.1 hypothetical protein GB879_007055 [Paracoccus sp. SMMA_5]UXU79593.1 hypothetical protein GB880_007045 [Paracoccus sp. SMMA_5_TC]
MRRWSHRIRGADFELDIDLSEVERLEKELDNTSKEIGAAVSKSLRRTASALRVMSSKRLVPELQLRKAMHLRRRMKEMRARLKRTDSHQVIGLWYGLNDLPVSFFKGTPRQMAKGAKLGGHEFPGAFVAKVGKKKPRSIYRRSGRGRFPLIEQTIPIKDRVDPILEDEIFPEATRIFLKNMMHELKWQRRQRGRNDKP